MNSVLERPLGQLLQDAPFVRDFLEAHELHSFEPGESFSVFVDGLSNEALAAVGMSRDELREGFLAFWHQMQGLIDGGPTVKSLQLVGGKDKLGRPETLEVKLAPGDVLSIVGPTGAGKSRLLEDIECLAQGDTPTGRRVLLNGGPVDDERRFGIDTRLVAQLSQNMNFVLDVSVEEFVALHAESRLLADVDRLVDEVYSTALRLAGEPFERGTSVTALSGGQSRALMIADTARLSRSPVVLVDEIENAGVDRKLALELLIGSDKIVLLVTHDPELALAAPRRLLVRDGGMQALVERSTNELQTLARLRQHSARIDALRTGMRQGEELLW